MVRCAVCIAASTTDCGFIADVQAGQLVRQRSTPQKQIDEFFKQRMVEHGDFFVEICFFGLPDFLDVTSAS